MQLSKCDIIKPKDWILRVKSLIYPCVHELLAYERISISISHDRLKIKSTRQRRVICILS